VRSFVTTQTSCSAFAVEVLVKQRTIGDTYTGGRQAKKPSNREWFELHCCGSSQEWAYRQKKSSMFWTLISHA
jgi:hypothetical protein